MRNFKKMLLLLLVLAAGSCFFSTYVFAKEAEPVVQKIPSRPSPEKGPTEVSIVVWVVDIDNIDSAAQNFMANVYFEMEWKDPQLAHGKKDPKLYSVIDVWTPQVQIVNETGIVRRTFPEIVEVSGDGIVTYRQRFVGPFSQPLDLRDFPFDKQKFQLHFVAVGNKESEVKFIPNKQLTAIGIKDACGIAKNISLPDWTIKSCQAKRLPYSPFSQARTSAGYVLEFVAVRGANYYILKVLTPLLLIVFMSWTVFWIDPSKFAIQMTISITSMLTLIAYRFSVDSQIPKVSYVTKLDFFILFSTILIFLSLIEVVIVSQLAEANRLALAKKIDFCSRILFPGVFFIITAVVLAIGAY